MADYIDCNKASFPLDGVLKSLFCKVDATGCTAFRIKLVTYANCTVITCTSKQLYEQLFKESIIIASDNLPAVRVCVTSHVAGAGLSKIDCMQQDLGILAGLTFCKDANGDVAVNIASVV